MISFKDLINIIFVLTFCSFIPSYGFAKGGKDLPLNERADYYERKMITALNIQKKEKYEKSCIRPRTET